MQLNNIFTIIFIISFSLSILIKLLLDIVNFIHRKKNEKTVPKELVGFIDEEKLQKINQYSNEKLKYGLFEYFFDNIVLILILFFGIIPLYYNFITDFTKNYYIIGLLFFGGNFLLQFILGIPFNLYFNFIIEKKFGFNQMTIKIWILDNIKQLVLSIIFGLIILVPLIFFLYNFKTLWWFFVWAFIFVFSIFMQIIYPTVIAPLFNKFKPLSNESLKIKIENLLLECGFKSSGVFEMDASKRSSHSNAYFTGFGKSKRIVLFDSLLSKHTEDEIIAILAHELGHFKHKHILKSMIFGTIFSFVGLFLVNFLIDYKVLYNAFLIKEEARILGLFLISIIYSPIGFFFSPISAYFSRKNEYQADKFAKDKLKTGEPLILALKKLSVDNLSNLYPAPIYSFFYYSHPPLFERIKVLMD
ncbi:MAG: hypothetical protein A2086_04285 [Spirochaetes bacterium GWD1_27_9]|nr:MAG: hypothetical protein A2Z98_06130 [Spirochaetes bacterium GWB1_27_13]OHD22398.1 MAG: hypothetical protein A2Y34_03470 [Spirochaetes bacterium GWC1_27_15]OHD41376.1 MAG: hypothetical protein A2086_04285 [Spirochaetes bacterium GWD1_27_9]